MAGKVGLPARVFGQRGSGHLRYRSPDMTPTRLATNRLNVIKPVIFGLHAQAMLKMKVNPDG
jgi:hypothetical protein